MERLVINRDGVHPSTKKPIYDTEGNALGAGSFYIKGRDNGFEKELLFRPISIYSRYFYFNPKTNQYDGETILAQSRWDEEEGRFIEDEPIDNKGTIRLGRPSPVEMKELDEVTQGIWRQKAKWQICIFGLAYFASQKDPILVEFDQSGKAGVGLSTYINKYCKKPTQDTILRLSLTPDGKHIKPTFNKIGVEPGDFSTFVQEVETHVDNYNENIRRQHREAVLAKGSK